MARSRKSKSRKPKLSKPKLSNIPGIRIGSLERPDYGWIIYITQKCKECDKIVAIMKKHGIKYQKRKVTNVPKFQEFLGVNNLISPPWLFYEGKFFGGYKKFMKQIAKLDDFELIPVTSKGIDLQAYNPIPLLVNASLFYLADKFPNACVIHNNEKNPEEILHSIVWNDTTDTLTVDDSIKWKFMKCLDKNPTFILISLEIQFSIGNHANFLIYDVAQHQMERFEPHGHIAVKNYYNPKIDDAILEYFDTEFPGLIEEYYTPKNFSQNIGFQMKESWENMKLSNDPGGFCVAWSIWYADMRMTYPDIPRQQLVKMAKQKLKLYPDLFTGYIRKYGAFLYAYATKLYNINFKNANKGFTLYSKDNQDVTDILEILDTFKVEYRHSVLPNKTANEILKNLIGINDAELPLLLYEKYSVGPKNKRVSRFLSKFIPQKSGWTIYFLETKQYTEMADKIYKFLYNIGRKTIIHSWSKSKPIRKSNDYPEPIIDDKLYKPHIVDFSNMYQEMIDYLLSSYSGIDFKGIWPRVYKDGVYIGSNLVEIFEYIRKNL